jgi:predicted SnoaL-like aldol condensation-catalyzing enzyme
MADPQMNKQTVLAHCNLAFNGRRPAEAVEKYGGSYYIQHNLQAPTASKRSFSWSQASWSSSPS